MPQIWTAATYEQHGRFVANLASDVLALLDPQAGERILDLGCGDGALTQQLVQRGAVVTCLDSSPTLVQSARAKGLDVVLGSGERLAYSDAFEAVFSNAALHWMLDQHAMLGGVRRALTTSGRFVAEMGGHGNIAAIRAALTAAMEPYGIDAEAQGANVFFTVDEYGTMLQDHGFSIDVIELVARPTLLPTGIEGWLQTFRRSVLDDLSQDAQRAVVERVAKVLRPILCDRSGRWFADYVRLRFRAYASKHREA